MLLSPSSEPVPIANDNLLGAVGGLYDGQGNPLAGSQPFPTDWRTPLLPDGLWPAHFAVWP